MRRIDNNIVAVIRKEQVYWICGSGFPAAIDLTRGWKAAPTSVFFSNLGLPDKRKHYYALEGNFAVLINYRNGSSKNLTALFKEMRSKTGLTPKTRQRLDEIFKQQGYADYKWIDPAFNFLGAPIPIWISFYAFSFFSPAGIS
jgi:hypothetical protein